MSAAEETAPETARSLRGAEIHESIPPVELKPASSLPEWAQPLSTSIPLIRVAQWAQRVSAGDLTMGPGSAAVHGYLLFAVAQFQGRNEASRASQETLSKFANSAVSTGRMALAELVEHGWLTRKDVVGRHGRETHYAVAAVPGRPIPARRNADNRRTHCAESGGPIAQNPADGFTENERTGSPVIGDKEIREEITEQIMEQTTSRAPADAPAREATPLVLFRDLEPAPPPSPAPKRTAKPKAPKKPKPTEWHPMPDDWQPSAAHRAYAAKHGLQLDFEADGFRGWAVGQKALSWDGTFTTRLANAAKWKTGKGAQGSTGAFAYGRGAPAPDRRQPALWAKEDPAAWAEFDREQEGAE